MTALATFADLRPNWRILVAGPLGELPGDPWTVDLRAQ